MSGITSSNTRFIKGIQTIKGNQANPSITFLKDSQTGLYYDRINDSLNISNSGLTTTKFSNNVIEFNNDLQFNDETTKNTLTISKTGNIEFGGNQVIGEQQPAIADVSSPTLVGSNTGTSATGLSLIGDTSTIDQSATIMNDLVALQEDINELQSKVNVILTALRTHGLIAT